MSRIDSIDKDIENGACSDMLLQERLNIACKIRDKEVKEFEDIKQKNKNKWSLEGDENSALFHRTLNKKKHTRNVKGVEINNVWEVDPSKVKEEFKNYFEQQFKEDPDCSWSQDLGNTSKLSRRERDDLEKPFDEKEVKEAIWNCGANKSPGPRWLYGGIFQKPLGSP